MKLLLSGLLVAYCIALGIRGDNYKTKLSAEKAKCDSLNLLLSDIKRDTTIYKLLNDYPYRVKVLTVANKITDVELIKILNRK